MNRNITLNTLKIASAAIIAIVVANLFHLSNGISAGIVAILSIQPTKKETLQTALSRFLAFIAALLIAYLAYHLAGYTIFGFAIYLVFFIYVCQKFQWLSAMAMDSVLISHFLGFQAMTMEHVANEFMIFMIGILAGIIANLHLHKDVSYIETLKTNTDMQMKKILHRMSQRMLEEDKSDYNGECFKLLDNMITEAQTIANLNFANQFTSKDTYDLRYIDMRRRQKDVLYEMYKLVLGLKTMPETIHVISGFLEEVSIAYQKDNTVTDLLSELYDINRLMQEAPMPLVREEFEDRALLFTLLRKTEEFLQLKATFIKTEDN